MSMTPQELEELRVQAGFKSKAAAARNIGVGIVTYHRWTTGTQAIPKIAENYLRLLIEKNNLAQKIKKLKDIEQ